MKTMLTLLYCFLALTKVFSQVIDLSNSTTRAVVIGISDSDYQDPGIPDLRFADRDAEAFAARLRSPEGGSIQERNLVLLTNR